MSNPKEQPRMRATSFADPNASAKTSSIGGVRTFREWLGKALSLGHSITCVLISGVAKECRVNSG